MGCCVSTKIHNMKNNISPSNSKKSKKSDKSSRSTPLDNDGLFEIVNGFPKIISIVPSLNNLDVDETKVSEQNLFNNDINQKILCVLKYKNKTKSDYFSKCEIGMKIGNGSFGKVYISYCDSEIHAVKYIYHKNDMNIVCDFLREIYFLENINHPNIIKYLDYDIDNTAIKIKMKYYNKTIKQYIENVILTYDTMMAYCILKNLIKNIIEGLMYLHSIGYCHLDIKPENIVVGNNTSVIIDFLTVTPIGNITTNIKGTHGFMAPELNVNFIYTEKCDIWALGKTLLILFNTSSNHTHTYDRYNNSDINIKCFQLKNIIEKCMANDPGERPTCDELLTFDFFSEYTVDSEFFNLIKEMNVKLNERSISLTSGDEESFKLANKLNLKIKETALSLTSDK